MPTIFTGVTESWGAKQKWTWQQLKDRLGQTRMKIGEDDDGKKLRIPFEEYLEYIVYNKDDSPLYLFEGSLDSMKKEVKTLMDDYTPSPIFGKNLFYLLGEDRMPPHRWFLVGPKRSGTETH